MKVERDNKRNGCLVALLVTLVTSFLLFLVFFIFLYKSILNV